MKSPFAPGDLVRMRPNVALEPLIHHYYAWLNLVSPLTAATTFTKLHVPMLRSYLDAPELHRRSAHDPKLRGGRFVDLPDDDLTRVAALAASLDDGAKVRLSGAVDELSTMLEKVADGYDLSPRYTDVPEPLRGYIELVYDLNDHARVRYAEKLLYRSRYFDEADQGVDLSLCTSDARPFAMTTPRFPRSGHVQAAMPLRDPRIDLLCSAMSTPCRFGELREAFEVSDSDLPAFSAFFDAGQAPSRDRSLDGRELRVRYFGHACVVVQSGQVTVMTDPFLSDNLGDDRFTYPDLPNFLDYVIITHSHQDHLELGTLLKLRHKIGVIVVPKTNSGALQDPSPRLCLEALGFPNVVDVEMGDILDFDGGRIVVCPFIGEHCDLDIGAKVTYAVQAENRTLYFGTDNRGVDRVLFKHIHDMVGDVDHVFLGMECYGAPLSWFYGPLFSRFIDPRISRSRRLNGSNAVEAMGIVRQLRARRASVYAMGREPWLNFIMATSYTEDSYQLQQMAEFFQRCTDTGVRAAELYGCAEVDLHEPDRCRDCIPAAETDDAPLSVAQRAIWLAEQLGPSGPAYHIRAELNLDGPVDRAALHAAFGEIIRRHAVLRTTIVEVNGEPRQRIHHPAPPEFRLLDLADAPVTATSWPRHEIVSQFANRPWDLAREWPIRIADAELPDGRTGLVIVAHHIAADPGAIDVLFNELGRLYAAYAAGRPSPLPEPPCQYADLARRQIAELVGPGAAARLARRQDDLAGAPHVIGLPLDRRRTQVMEHGGGTVPLAIPGALAVGVARLAAEHRTTVFGVLLTALALTLQAYGAGDDMLIGTPSLQRDDGVTRQLIGCLVNVLPIRVRLTGSSTITEVLRDVRSTVLTALEFRAVPFDTLVGALQVKRRVEMPPLTQVSIRVAEPVRRSIEIGDLRATLLTDEAEDSVKYDLALEVNQADGGLSGTFEYRRALFDAATIERLAGSFVAILEQIAANPDGRVDALWTMPRRNLRAVLDGWNPAPLPAEVARRFGLPNVARCYVLDLYGRPAPVNVPGELYLAGLGELPDPYTWWENARMLATATRFRWSPEGRLAAVAETAQPEPGPQTQTEPGPGAVPADSGGALDDEVIAVIRDIWGELLGARCIAPSDDFFDLGGDSLFAIRYMSRIRKRFQVRVSLREIFMNPSLSGQVHIVVNRRDS